MINTGRARLGLPAVANPLSLLADEPVIVAADSDLAPLGDDAPERVVCTDAWPLEDSTTLDSRLDAFLRLEPPPIYVGFGSMVPRHAPELAGHAVASARALGHPLILAGGWAALDRYVAGADDVRTVDAVPHRAVLPRVAAAVHHGGAGTTTAAARAGVPQVILPYLLDQYYWAHRVEQLGLGPRALPAELVNADVLTDRIATALHDPRIRSRAAAFAPVIASRNGVTAAVSHLEALTDGGHRARTATHTRAPSPQSPE
jgi:vancomycin aglycone glucosyltransferase